MPNVKRLNDFLEAYRQDGEYAYQIMWSSKSGSYPDYPYDDLFCIVFYGKKDESGWPPITVALALEYPEWNGRKKGGKTGPVEGGYGIFFEPRGNDIESDIEYLRGLADDRAEQDKARRAAS